MALLTLTGGALVTAFGIYTYFSNKPRASVQQTVSKNNWWRPARLLRHRRSDLAVEVEAEEIVELDQEGKGMLNALEYKLRTSSISLGITTVGLIFFKPLRYASIPTLIYMGIPSAQDAYDHLHDAKRVNIALAETIILAVCLASGYYWIGSLGFFVYYLSLSIYHKQQPEALPNQANWQLPQTTCLLKGTEEIKVSTTTLQCGDRVLVQTSEMIPTDGVIMQGSAWLKSPVLGQTMPEVYKCIGDRVAAADVVLVGRICVQVL